MKYTTRKYSVANIITDYDKPVGKNMRLVFDCPIQRPSGQWSNPAQSLLIHSILQDYLIPNVCIVQHGADEFEPMTVLDGKQRMTIVYNYVNNKFKLNTKTPKVEIKVPQFDEFGELLKDDKGITVSRTEEVEIKNKSFDKLPMEFQDKIKKFEFNVTLITQATKEELEEQMFRFNNGKTPTSTLKAVMRSGIDVAEAIRDSVINNNFFQNRFDMGDKTKQKNAEDMRCAFHALTLFNNGNYNKLTSTDLTKIAEQFKKDWKNGSFTQRNIDSCNDLFDILNYCLPDESEIDTKKIMNTIHIPVMVMNAEKYTQLKDDEEITEEQYKKFLSYWTKTGFYSEEYQKYTERTPADRANVEGRIDVMEQELLKFIGMADKESEIETTIEDDLNSLPENMEIIVDCFPSKLDVVKSMLLLSENCILDFSRNNLNTFIEHFKNSDSDDEILKCLGYKEMIPIDIPFKPIFIKLAEYVEENDIDKQDFKNWLSIENFGEQSDIITNAEIIEQFTVLRSKLNKYIQKTEQERNLKL